MKSILDLLKRQPKIIKKTSLFVDIVTIYNSSLELKRLKISNYCFNLLNKAKILPEKLNIFYKKFKLPKSYFFPLFLKLKKEYIDKLNKKKREKNLYIYNKMITLSENIKSFIKFFAVLEKKLNKAKKSPLWNKLIYPKSKSKVDKYLRYNNIEWVILFFNFLAELEKKYNYKIENSILRKMDLFILEIYNEKYNNDVIIKKFRELSKKYHPDCGGVAKHFNMLKDAKERLLKKERVN